MSTKPGEPSFASARRRRAGISKYAHTSRQRRFGDTATRRPPLPGDKWVSANHHLVGMPTGRMEFYTRGRAHVFSCTREADNTANSSNLLCLKENHVFKLTIFLPVGQCFHYQDLPPANLQCR